MNETSAGVVLVVGAEPAAFSCCFELLEAGIQVHHAYPEPLGLHGSSRDIGLAYPELGEPWERLEYALGEEVALELHRWSRAGVESLLRRAPELVQRGSRLAVARTEQESRLLSEDALKRSRPPVNDELRLMSGPAVSNFAPVHAAVLGSFETHAVAFAPVPVLEHLAQALNKNRNYRGVPVGPNWLQSKVVCDQEGVKLLSPETCARGDIAIVSAGLQTRDLLDKFHKCLIPISGQAFRSQPLKEKLRSSVLGVTASWGYERYRFDEDYRLLGCGVDPSGGGGGAGTNVEPKSMSKFLNRAADLFVDFDATTEEETMRWGIEFDGTCDGLPILGALIGEPRIQVACGFGLAAWSRGWEAGRRIALNITSAENGERSALLPRCSQSRFELGKSRA
ncbi:MAG: FAD-binding oxidoreductase [Vulcanimicrobiota bacterium]